MTERETPGRATFKQEIVTTDERTWRRIIASIEEVISVIPDEYVNEDGYATPVITVDGIHVSVAHLGPFRYLSADPAVSTTLFVGANERGERGLYEYGFAPSTLDEDGVHSVEENVEGVRQIKLATLTTEELTRIHRYLVGELAE